jgi:hypothetical protein
MKDFKNIREDARDPRSMSSQTLSRYASTPGHPMSSVAKDELARRKTQEDTKEGAMKRIATTQSNKADRMASTDKKGLETFKKKVDEISVKKISDYIPKAARQAGTTGVDVKTKDKRIAGISRADDKVRKTYGYGNQSKVAATEDVNEMGPRHTSSPMKDRFGGAVDSKKFGTYKAHMKKHNLDEPTVRMIHKNPDEAESKRMMKNPKYAQAVSLYKDAQRKESVDLSKIRTMLDKE